MRGDCGAFFKRFFLKSDITYTWFLFRKVAQVTLGLTEKSGALGLVIPS